MAHEFGLAVLAQHRAELLTAQQLEGAHAAAAAAGAVEAQALAGFGLLQGERIKVGEDILQQQMELIYLKLLLQFLLNLILEKKRSCCPLKRLLLEQ